MVFDVSRHAKPGGATRGPPDGTLRLARTPARPFPRKAACPGGLLGARMSILVSCAGPVVTQNSVAAARCRALAYRHAPMGTAHRGAVSLMHTASEGGLQPCGCERFPPRSCSR